LGEGGGFRTPVNLLGGWEGEKTGGINSLSRGDEVKGKKGQTCYNLGV